MTVIRKLTPGSPKPTKLSLCSKPSGDPPASALTQWSESSKSMFSASSCTAQNVGKPLLPSKGSNKNSRTSACGASSRYSGELSSSIKNYIAKAPETLLAMTGTCLPHTIQFAPQSSFTLDTPREERQSGQRRLGGELWTNASRVEDSASTRLPEQLQTELSGGRFAITSCTNRRREE